MNVCLVLVIDTVISFVSMSHPRKVIWVVGPSNWWYIKPLRFNSRISAKRWIMARTQVVFPVKGVTLT